MKKSFIFIFAIACALMLFCALPVCAGSEYVLDYADTMTDEQEAELDAEVAHLRETYGMDVVILTVESLEGGNAQEVADDFYDYNGYANDGVLFLHAPLERDYAVSTKGAAITALTDYGLEYIRDDFVEYLQDDDFFGAYKSFTSDTDIFLKQAATGEPYDVDNTYKDSAFYVTAELACLIVAFLIGLIVAGSKKRKMRTVFMQTEADDYIKDGSFALQTQNDVFLYSNIIATPIPRDSGRSSGGGGGSSVHIGSSGSSHGGISGHY